MVQYAETQHALEGDIASVTPAKGIKLIEAWEDSLKDVDAPGAKGVLRDLGALKTALGKDQPDGERIRDLLGKLGDATTKIAGKAEGASGEKLTAIGDGLTKAAS